MIPVASLLYKIDFRLNKIATNQHQSIPLEDKILALNEGQIKLIKRKLSVNNVYRAGLDSFKKRYEDLENIIQPHIPVEVTKDPDSKLNKYLSPVPDGSLYPKYMFFVDCYFLASKGLCTNRVITTTRVKHADIHTVLANDNTNPSFEYQEAPLTLTNQTLEIYTDGTFEPESAYLSYIRYPQKIDFEGYIDFDGSASITQDCELRDYLEDELVDITVQILAMSTENQAAVQNTQANIQNNE